MLLKALWSYTFPVPFDVILMFFSWQPLPRDPELLLVANFLVEDVVLLGHQLLVDLPLQVCRGVGGLWGAVQLQQIPNLGEERSSLNSFSFYSTFFVIPFSSLLRFLLYKFSKSMLSSQALFWNKKKVMSLLVRYVLYCVAVRNFRLLSTPSGSLFLPRSCIFEFSVFGNIWKTYVKPQSLIYCRIKKSKLGTL